MKRIVQLTAISALLLVGAGCQLLQRAPAQPAAVTLEYWRPTNESAALQPAIDAYRATHPNVSIRVRNIRPDEYEDMLTTALAEDRGPDMFSLPNTWLRGWKARIVPVPQADGGLTVRRVTTEFVEIVAKDILLPGDPTAENARPGLQAFGVPYSADTLVMFVNNRLLAKSGASTPPATWKELRDVAKSITVTAQDGTILQSGAALGTGANVRHMPDILAAMMAQNGAIMTADGNDGVTFSHVPPGLPAHFAPGAEALSFYQSFAAPDSEFRMWDATMPDSLEAFTSGRAAFAFGYPEDAALIREMAPKLDFSVAALPQSAPERPRNIARYLIEVVSRKSRNQAIAWDFLQFAASAANVKPFLDATLRPTALRSLVQAQSADPMVAPFSSQVLTAISWYRGRNPAKAEEVFRWMADTLPASAQFPNWQQTVSRGQMLINQSY